MLCPVGVCKSFVNFWLNLFFLPIDTAIGIWESRIAATSSNPVYRKNNKFLKDNFAPVEKELFASNCEVEGEIPKELEGEFVRNGPNPQHEKQILSYHWFDGDGMIHGVRLKAGKASYANHYVRNKRFLLEGKAGKPLYVRLGEMIGVLGLVKLMLFKAKCTLGLVQEDAIGTSNTSVEFHGGRLLALVESDMPYAVKIMMDGQLETLGAFNYQGKLKHPFSAHPKLDYKTGEMMTFGYQIHKKPFCSYSLISREGELKQTVVIEGVKEPVMMHDMAVTEHYSIFLDLPMVFQPKIMVSEGRFPIAFVKRDARFGVIKRNATTCEEMKWFSLPPQYFFHVLNAWEEGDEIVMYAMRINELDLTGLELGGKETWPLLFEYRFNMATGAAVEQQFPEQVCGEFPRVDPRLIGYKCQYGYISLLDPNSMLFTGVVKVDLFSKQIIHRIDWPKGCTAGECTFVPRTEAADEDDGYLLTYVYNSSTNLSELWIIDASTMSETPVAKVKLPQRVPYGFHGNWVSERQLKDQKLTL